MPQEPTQEYNPHDWCCPVCLEKLLKIEKLCQAIQEDVAAIAVYFDEEGEGTSDIESSGSDMDDLCRPAKLRR